MGIYRIIIKGIYKGDVNVMSLDFNKKGLTKI